MNLFFITSGFTRSKSFVFSLQWRQPHMFFLATLATHCHIFFKIQVVFNNYQYRSCIYQDRNKQWMKPYFSSKYKMCSIIIQTEAVFTKTEINNKWKVRFLQISSLEIQLPYSSEFSIGQSTTFDMVLSFLVLWMFFMCLYLTHEIDFKLRK